MVVVAVIDTNVLRYALEDEKTLKRNYETRIAYEILVKLLKEEDTVVVFNSETAKEYSRHIEVVRTELRRKRIYPHFFSLLRILKSKSRKVPAEDIHLKSQENQLDERTSISLTPPRLGH